MSMRARQKAFETLYPRWSRKQESPARLAKIRDGNCCTRCGVADRTLVLDELGLPHHMVYVHAAHLCYLDPLFFEIEPIAGQRLLTLCPTCHGSYDHYWKPRVEEAEHQARLHNVLLGHVLPGYPWLSKRFLEVI